MLQSDLQIGIPAQFAFPSDVSPLENPAGLPSGSFGFGPIGIDRRSCLVLVGPEPNDPLGKPSGFIQSEKLCRYEWLNATEAWAFSYHSTKLERNKNGFEKTFDFDRNTSCLTALAKPPKL